MKSLEKRKKAILYILVFCVLVTALAFFSPLLGGTPSKPGLGFIIWGLAPLIAAMVMRIVTRDWADTGFKPQIRKNARWYIVSIIAFPIMTVLTTIIGSALSVSSFSGFSLVEYLKTFLAALPLFFVFAIFEEFGWRGYLVPKLNSIGTNSYLTAAIVAVVWSTWHMPYIRELLWVYSTEDLMIFIPRYYLALFAFALVYNEIRIITGSVWPAVLMHCVMNSFAHPLDFNYITIMPGMDFLVSASGIFMIVFAGVLGIALNRWRIKKQSNILV